MATRKITTEPGHSFKDAVSNTPETTISVGDTIEWVNNDGEEHTIVSDNVPPFNTLTPPLNGDIANANDTYPYPLPFQAGDYGYHCDIHGGDPATKLGMYGIIHVKAAAESTVCD